MTKRGEQLILHGGNLRTDATQAFDGVVLATTATVASKLISELDEQLVSDPTRQFVGTQKYVPNIHVAFVADDRAALPPMSSLFPCGPYQSKVAAINFNSHKQQVHPQEGRPQDVVGVFLTAQESQHCLGMQDDELSEHAWRSARELCPHLPLKSRLYKLIKRPEAIPVHSVGRYRTAAEILNTQRNPVVFAGDYLASATVDGALYTGLRAAQALVANLGNQSLS